MEADRQRGRDADVAEWEVVVVGARKVLLVVQRPAGPLAARRRRGDGLEQRRAVGRGGVQREAQAHAREQRQLRQQRVARGGGGAGAAAAQQPQPAAERLQQRLRQPGVARRAAQLLGEERAGAQRRAQHEQRVVFVACL